MKQPKLKIDIKDLKYGNDLTSKSHNWTGGRVFNGSGYILVKCPNHPNCDNRGYILEHRIVMEKHIGRYLLPEERVHNINCIKIDNNIENLQLFKNESEHQKLGHFNYDHFICRGREKEYAHEYYLTHKEKYIKHLMIKYNEK